MSSSNAVPERTSTWSRPVGMTSRIVCWNSVGCIRSLSNTSWGHAMRYRLFGKSGLRVSELALGTMTFGEAWGWGAGREESRKIFGRFDEAGGNFVDTANNYTDGESEQFVGEFIRPERERWVVASKYTLTTRRDDPNAGGNHRKN